MVHGRMIVCAWEAGLKDVEEKAVKLVMQAVEHQLKKIISQVLSRRNGYKLREKRFQYAMGCKVPNPYLRHSILIPDSTLESEATTITDSGNHIPSIKLPYDFAESHAAQQISMASTCAINRGLVTLYDLLEALQLYRNAIPSHTVYATAMERIIHKLWHTSNEELEQEVTHRQEILVKQQLVTQHAPIR
ncbi:hypothetical protein CHS0354_004799 [Potamilus streckersoni]|uniref:Uncharacterized protein n=1 Tax=Potamilus streckersoni TaxID=2493646 RepID=A0AAE0SY57_9BIVA|nr:hypothetical protein CHS0354_004799 [Potamilus streckersoni]